MIKDNKDFDFFETLGGHPVFLFVNKFIAKGVLFLTAVVSPALISFVILRIGTGDWPVASETGVFIYVMGVCGGVLASMASHIVLERSGYEGNDSQRKGDKGQAKVE